jgi:hypothetical protein
MSMASPKMTEKIYYKSRLLAVLGHGIDVAIDLGTMLKQRFEAALYYILIIVAVYITGCRNALAPSDGSGLEGGGGSNSATLSAPSQIDASAVSTTEIDVTWVNTDFPDLQKVSLEYKKSSVETYTTMNADVSTQYSLTGLEANTAYDIRLKSIASDAKESDYSDVATATTMNVVIANSYPTATITSASVYDGQILIAHTWSSTDTFYVQNIYCESKLVTGSVWAAYRTGTSGNFGNPSFCNTNVNGAESIGKRQYRIRVHFNNGTAETLSNVSAELVAKLPAPTNVNLFPVSINEINWSWLQTYDPLYHTGFSVHFAWSPPTIFYSNTSTMTVAYNDYDAQTVCGVDIVDSWANHWTIQGNLTVTLIAVGGNSVAHHDYPQSSAAVIVSGTCP